jgi:hypothetical protein
MLAHYTVRSSRRWRQRNRALPIDGGLHEPWSTKVTLASERDKQSVKVPKFKELPKLVMISGDRIVLAGRQDRR